jgi:hypothetical protein
MKSLPFMFSMIALALCLSFGCATTSSIGDQMVDRGKNAKKIGKQWNKGERMVEKGEQYMAKSEKLMNEGQQLVEQGRKLMAENEAAYNRTFTETE